MRLGLRAAAASRRLLVHERGDARGRRARAAPAARAPAAHEEQSTRDRSGLRDARERDALRPTTRGPAPAAAGRGASRRSTAHEPRDLRADGSERARRHRAATRPDAATLAGAPVADAADLDDAATARARRAAARLTAGRGHDRRSRPPGKHERARARRRASSTTSPTAVDAVRSAFLMAALAGLVAALLARRRARRPTLVAPAARLRAQRPSRWPPTAPARRAAARRGPRRGRRPRARVRGDAAARCATRRRRGARSWRPPRTSCARRWPRWRACSSCSTTTSQRRPPDLDDASRRSRGAQAQLRGWRASPPTCSTSAASTRASSCAREPVELGELARAVAAEFELRAGERDVELDVAPPTGPCWALGDPGAVARIVRILRRQRAALLAARRADPRRGRYSGEHARRRGLRRRARRARGRARADLRALPARQPHRRRGRVRPGPGDRPRARRADGRRARLRVDRRRRGARFVLGLAIELPRGSGGSGVCAGDAGTEPERPPGPALGV